MKNLIIRCYLTTPISKDSIPFFDSLIGYEIYAKYHGSRVNPISRDSSFSNAAILPIDEFEENGIKIYKCSDPILSYNFTEIVENQAKRFDVPSMANLLPDFGKKTVLVGSGCYKNRFYPARFILADSITWFVSGFQKEIESICNEIYFIGKYRGYGYGQIAKWEFIEIKDDNSIFAKKEDKRVLMKRIPASFDKTNLIGFRRGVGGFRPPYWHPENTGEILIPC